MNKKNPANTISDSRFLGPEVDVYNLSEYSDEEIIHWIENGWDLSLNRSTKVIEEFKEKWGYLLNLR